MAKLARALGLNRLSLTHRRDILAGVGEFVGTTAFLFLSLAGAKTAALSVPITQNPADITTVGLAGETIIYTSLSFGLSLIVTAWAFFRITGALFNPAITLALWSIGAISIFRATLLTISQLAGGLAAAGLVALLTPHGTVNTVVLHPAAEVTNAQGLFLESLLTSMLVFVVLMLAAEKHKGTFMAPVGIGLTLFICHLVGVAYTGCGMNPSRALGPSAVARDFGTSHWIYWIGPMIGSFFAVGFYMVLKALKYEEIALNQDSSEPIPGTKPAHHRLVKRINTYRIARPGSKVTGPTVTAADGTVLVAQGEAVVIDMGSNRVVETGLPPKNGSDGIFTGAVHLTDGQLVENNQLEVSDQDTRPLGIQADVPLPGSTMMGKQNSNVSVFAAPA